MGSNKFKGVYAALCENEEAVRRSRAINNANVLALGGLVTTPEDATKMADAFLEQEFMRTPVRNGEKPPEWWTPEVEEFLSGTMPEIAELEDDAHASAK